MKNLPPNAGDAGDMGSIPGLGRFPGEGNGNPLQYSCLGNPMDGGASGPATHGGGSDSTRSKKTNVSSSERSDGEDKYTFKAGKTWKLKMRSQLKKVRSVSNPAMKRAGISGAGSC